VMFEDIESVWLGKETADEMLKKAETTYQGEMAQGLTQPLPKPNL
jgi:raffinose/stachyose/melibiose transport system substrate-binding protein